MPIRVFNSNSLSTITSVGIHALVLLLILPRVASLSASNPENESRNVELIELSPAEQSRLPNPSSSSDIPPLANTPLGDIPVVDSPSQQPPVPNYLNNLPAPPTLPALPALPPLYGNSNIGGLPIASPPPSLRIPQNFTPRSLPLPPQGQTLPPLPGSEISQEPQRPTFEPLKPPVPIDDLINGRNGDRPQPEQVAVNTPSNPNWANNRDTTAPSDDRIGRLVAATLQGADNLRYNGNNTSDQEANQNDIEWMRKTGQLLKRNQIVTIQGTYPRAACGLQLKGSPVYNVVVDGQGNLAQPPFLTRSSGYGILNNQGLQEVRSRGFSQSTRVTVVFTPDPSVCPQIARGTQTPELPDTQTPPVQETPPVTPPSEARRNPPETAPIPQEKPPVTPPSEARRNPPETAPIPQEKPPVTPPSEARRNPPEPAPIPQEKPQVTPPSEARRNVPEPLPPVEPPANVPPAPATGRKEPEASVIPDNGALGNPLPRKEE
ncbi:energy transducer TonB [Aphanothece sacrum FPU1]|uniref:Energy transducer TonB n=2 Tax=Aphanothece sacrum TaxID=1122 RepID=A0A401IK06_APHSA|nr:energy transducer TonB [Aphanothece sacrum FPU1]